MNQQQYSVPRTELLAWINSTLNLHITKIEQVELLLRRSDTLGGPVPLPVQG